MENMLIYGQSSESDVPSVAVGCLSHPSLGREERYGRSGTSVLRVTGFLYALIPKVFLVGNN